MLTRVRFALLLVFLFLLAALSLNFGPSPRAQSGPTLCDVASAGVCVDPATVDFDDPNDDLPEIGGEGFGALAVTSNARVNTKKDNGKPQNEPYVAIKPDDPTKLVAGAKDYFFGAGNSSCGFYRSTDGAGSWQPGTALPVPSGYNSQSDPGLAWSPDLGGYRRVYYSCVLLNSYPGDLTPDNGSIWVTYSQDDGAHYPIGNGKIVAQGSQGTPPWPPPIVFHDKPFIAADPQGGNVYVAWTRFEDFKGDDVQDTGEIRVKRSTDNGFTFGDLHTVSTAPLNQGAVPLVGPGGVVYIVYAVLGGPAHRVSSLEIVSSTDGGVSWTSPSTVANVIGLPATLPNTLIRVNSFATAAVDPVNGHIYVAWADNGTFDLFGGNGDILFTRWDGGSWSTPQNLTSGNTNDQFFPWLSVAPNGNIDLVYYSRLNTTSKKINVFHQRSTDGGLQFSGETLVNLGGNIRGGTQFSGGFIGDYIGVASGPSGAVAVWMDTRRTIPGSITQRHQDVYSAVIP